MFRRLAAIILVGLLASERGSAQISDNSLATATYNPHKYSLSFADQSQIAYDGSPLKNKINPGMLDASDVAYYRGHYINAAGRYQVVAGFPKKINSWGAEDVHLFSTIKNILSTDVDKIDDENLRLFCSGVNSVGMLYHTRGKYIPAELLLQFNLDLRAKRFGKTSRDYINSLHNLAVLKKDLGQYEMAERIFDYLVPTFKKLYTANSIQYAVVINNKAMLLAELGRTQQATVILDECLGIGKTVFYPQYIDYERVLTNRALLEQEIGNLDAAESYYKQAIAGMEQKELDDHPDYNNVLVNYGSLLVQRGDQHVLEFIVEIAAKIKSRYSEKHPMYAKALGNQGQFYFGSGTFDLALPIFQRVAEIQLNLLGEKHKDYLSTLMKIGICQWQLNNFPGAAGNFKKAIDNYMFLVDELFPSMSESEKAKFWMSLKPSIDTYISFVLDADQKQLLTGIYNLHLKTKGLLISATNQTKAAILATSDSTLKQLYTKWLDVKNTLAIYYASTLEDLNEDKVDMVKLEEQANNLEKRLSSLSSKFSDAYERKEIGFQDVSKALKPDEAALEIIRVSYLYGKRKGEIEYAGFIVKSDSQLPELVRLREGSDLEKRYLTFYKNSIRIKSPDDRSYDYYWRNFEKPVHGKKRIYVSVDGVFNSINLNTLRMGDHSYLIDHANIVLIPNSKVIASGLLMNIDLKSNRQEALLIGSPAFGNSSAVAPLPGTKIEVENIGALLNGHHVATSTLIGGDASETNVKAVADPSVLHIATHGYFLSDVAMSAGMSMGVQVSKAKENPLLRSGLLLAGASVALSDEPTMGGPDNGLLNAYEVMNLDLRDTKIVIMSACETGSGEIVNGEGVYGLTRAFQVAGAKKIIMSLWKVDDEATERLMTTFYKQWIVSNNPQEAFLFAQRSIKETYPEPYYWGAFVLVN